MATDTFRREVYVKDRPGLDLILFASQVFVVVFVVQKKKRTSGHDGTFEGSVSVLVCVSFLSSLLTLQFFEGVKISVTDEEAAQESSGNIGQSF